VDGAGRVTRFLAGTRVLWDGQPSPVLYAQQGQVNAVVPYGVAGKDRVQVQVEARAQKSNVLLAAVTPSAPGLFTLDASGTGQAAAVNQDNSLNSAANPAPRGSVVSLFAAGTGETAPPGTDGETAISPLPAPVLPVSVQIAGHDAEILFAGSVPGLVAGILQVNVRIPGAAADGNGVSVVLRCGGAQSQPGVTLAIV
jgi:uncharacterized protein (TIGR03437 family)